MHRVLPKVISVKLDNSASKRVLTAMKDDLRDEIVTKIEEGYLHAQKKKAQRKTVAALRAALSS